MKHWGRGAVAGLYFAILGMGSPALAADDPAKDVQAVYCLSNARRDEVIQAAGDLRAATPVPSDPARVALGTKPARNVTLEELRKDFPKTFERVCAAVMKVNAVSSDGSGGGGSGWLLSLGLAAAGSGFTLLGQFVERGGTRRRQLRDTLLSALREYKMSAEAYIGDWENTPGTSHRAVESKRAILVNAIGSLLLTGDRRRQASRLAAELPLKDHLPESDTSTAITRQIPPGVRMATVAEVRERLDAAISEAESLTSGRTKRAWRFLHRRVSAVGRRRGHREEETR